MEKSDFEFSKLENLLDPKDLLRDSLIAPQGHLQRAAGDIDE